MLKGKLEGLKLSIVDDVIVEDIVFSGDLITSTIGIRDGAICAPILTFEVTGDDSLVIDKEHFNIKWKQVSIMEDIMSVIRNGKPTVYKIVSRPSAIKRKLP